MFHHQKQPKTMALVKFNSALPSLVEGFINRDFDNFVAPQFFGNLPAVNVLESQDGFKLEVAAPGYKKEDFNVSIQHNVLTISASQENKTEEVKPKYARKEFSFGSFKRTFTLPQTVNGEQINATYSDGILHVTLPKKEEAKPKAPATIEIK